MTEGNTRPPKSQTDAKVTGDTVAVILAAGAGHRWKGPTAKLLAALPDGAMMLSRVCERAISAGIGPTVLVVVAGQTAAAELPPGATRLINPAPEDGLASSLQVAIAEARRLGATAVVVGLADQPGLTADGWRAVANADAALAVATYDRRRGHPVKIASTLWAELPRHGDRGAGDLLARGPVVEVPAEGDPTDIDRVEDMRDWWGRDDPAKHQSPR